MSGTTSSAELSDSKTVIPTSNISFADENVQRQSGIRRMGYLKKLYSNKGAKSERKFYVLREPTATDGAILEYFDKQSKFRAKNQQGKLAAMISGAFAVNRKEDCKQDYVTSIFTNTTTHSMIACSEMERQDWMRDLIELQSSGKGEPAAHNPQQLFKPRFDYVWNVDIVDKGLANAKHISGPHRICLSERTVRLFPMDPKSENDAFAFPLVKLRKVGHNDKYFYLEVGRHACTGPGEFCMAAENKQSAQHIHDIISEAMRKSGPADDTVSGSSTPGHRTRSNTADQRTRQAATEPRRNTFDPTEKKSQELDVASATDPAPRSSSTGEMSIPTQVLRGGRSTLAASSSDHHHTEYTIPEFAHSSSVEENYLPIDMSNAYLACDFGANKQASPFQSRQTNYSAIVKPADLTIHPVPPNAVTSAADLRPSLSPTTIIEEPSDYMAINMGNTGSQSTLHNEPTSNLGESGYFEMNLPLKGEASKTVLTSTTSATKVVPEEANTYMMMGPGSTSSGVASDSRRSTMSSSSYQSHASEKEVNSDVTYSVMEPTNTKNRGMGSWDNSNSSLGSASNSEWNKYSSLGMRPEHKLEKVRAYMLDDQDSQLRETRAYSTGCHPSKPTVSFKPELPTVLPSSSEAAFRTRAFSLGNHPTPTSKSSRRLVHSPSSAAIITPVRTTSPLSRDIRMVSCSDTQLSPPDSGAATPIRLLLGAQEKKPGEGSSKSEDMMEVVFRPKSG